MFTLATEMPAVEYQQATVGFEDLVARQWIAASPEWVRSIV